MRPRGALVSLQILALDTATEWCSAALWCDGAVHAREAHAGQRHSELILPMVDTLLRVANVELSGLDGIAFGSGPGSFTGLRIACGVAQGMAYGAGLKLAPVSTLEALAQASGAPRVIAALDARMGEIYHAAYVREGRGWRCVASPSLCRPLAAPPVDGSDWIGAGSAFAVHGEILAARYAGQLAGTAPELVPLACHILPGAIALIERGEVVAPALAAPLYVRDKVAMTVAERAARNAASR